MMKKHFREVDDDQKHSKRVDNDQKHFKKVDEYQKHSKKVDDDEKHFREIHSHSRVTRRCGSEPQNAAVIIPTIWNPAPKQTITKIFENKQLQNHLKANSLHFIFTLV